MHSGYGRRPVLILKDERALYILIVLNDLVSWLIKSRCFNVWLLVKNEIYILCPYPIINVIHGHRNIGPGSHTVGIHLGTHTNSHLVHARMYTHTHTLMCTHTRTHTQGEEPFLFTHNIDSAVYPTPQSSLTIRAQKLFIKWE